MDITVGLILGSDWSGRRHRMGAHGVYSNRFASPASPGGQRTCAELKLDELTVLMLAELNYFPGYDIIAERNDLPDSDIIEYRPYINALIFYTGFFELGMNHQRQSKLMQLVIS